LGAFSGGIRGIFEEEVERGCFQRFGEARQAFLKLIGAQRFLPPRIPHLLLGLKVSVPGLVGVAIKGIVVQGELIVANSDFSSGS
jgi:hypothetical protein